MAGYNISRSVQELLNEHESSPPSFTVHLYPEHWTLNNGSKFLYNNQVASLLDDIRAQRIPVDFLELFDAANVPFYEGCMIVELLDYRPQKAKDAILTNPERSRVVLTPSSETLWADICLLNQKAGNIWTDQEALEVEARILVATAPPLCLDPDPHLTRMANHVLRVSVPKTPPSLKRKAAAMEQEEEENDKARRIKISQYMNPRNSRSTPQSYRILDLLQKIKESKVNTAAVQQEPTPAVPSSIPPDPQHGINPAALLAKANQPVPPQPAANLPNIMPAPSVPAPPTGATLAVFNGQPAKIVRQSPRPPSTVPPSAIPPHMQMYPTARNTPSPAQPSQTPMPRPPSSVSGAAQASPIMRSSSVQQSPQQAGQQIQQHPAGSQTRSPAMQAASTQPVPTVAQPQPPAQSTIPTAPNIQQPQSNPHAIAAFIARLQKKPVNPVMIQQLTKMTPQQQQSWLAQQQARMYAAAQQARMNGSATPAQNTSPRPPTAMSVSPGMQQQQQQQQPQQQPHPLPQQAQQHQVQQHQAQQQMSQQGSPMHVNQPLTARSPMPNNAQVQQMPHPQAHAAYNQYALAQAQAQAQNHQFNPALLRPVMPGHPPHAQLVSHIANGNAQAGMLQQQGQDQANGQPHPSTPAMMQHYPMYNYAQINMNMQQAAAAGRIPQYWPSMGVGRGMPSGVGPNMMPSHAQQMQMGGAKTVSGGMQGA